MPTASVTERAVPAGQRPGVGRIAVLAAGNVLLGASIGILAYGGLSNLATMMEQRNLRSAPYLAASVPKTLPATGAAPMDLEGWEAQDGAYWKALPQGGVFGRIVAPKMGLDAAVVRGTARADLAKGPGWIESTDLPGAGGNTGISGHRTTFLAPFRDIDRLGTGDTIDLYSPYRRYRYEVTEQLVVTPDRVDVLDDGPQPMLTLTACHPPYSARYRLVVHARLVEVRRIESAGGP
ncbi:MAG: class E sortase [Actinobacteria bacterium]|nr:MAG: class E sortase [Actinomycetota bacterium]